MGADTKRCCCNQARGSNFILYSDVTGYSYFVSTDLSTFTCTRIINENIVGHIARDPVTADVFHIFYGTLDYRYWYSNISGSWVRDTVKNLGRVVGISHPKPGSNPGDFSTIMYNAGGTKITSRYDYSLDTYTEESNNIDSLNTYPNCPVQFDSSGYEHVVGWNASFVPCVWRYTGSTTWVASSTLTAPYVPYASAIYNDDDYCIMNTGGPGCRLGVWDGSSWSFTTIDGTVGRSYADMVIDDSGIVHVALCKGVGTTEGGDNLVDIQYGTNSGGSFSLETVDSSVNVSHAGGSEVHLILSGGTPIIAYWEWLSSVVRLHVAYKSSGSWTVLTMTNTDTGNPITASAYDMC